ncbi:polymorphic toxin type 15 domain-containing protein [Tenacibaculum maritimum]|uniref:polymorphic toxin type 15 domain-containing protein n=1 Tax=Tenacibaculum maritimum TaxID=107401 RepID=UPI001330B175|nr:polymorphic toxin type 15 domain-containing protein [Tenacibaculum maritimum]
MTKIPTHKKGTTGNQHKTTSYDNSNYYDQVSSNIHNSLGTQAAALGDTAKNTEQVLHNDALSTPTKVTAVALNVAEAGMQAMGALGAVDDALESALLPVLGALGMQGLACLPISKQLDPVMGIDIHFVTIPPSPAPIPMPHPYIGMLFRAKDFASAAIASVIPAPPTPPAVENPHAPNEQEQQALNTNKAANLGHMAASMVIGMLGATVKIGGYQPRAVAGTPTKSIPHFPMGTGFHPAFTMVDKNIGHAFMGSLFTLADQDPISGGPAHLHLNCNDVGIVSPHDLRPSKNTETDKDAKINLYLPTGVINPIPPARSILTNPVPAPMNPVSAIKQLFKASLGRFYKKKSDVKTTAVDSINDRKSQKNKKNECINTGKPKKKIDDKSKNKSTVISPNPPFKKNPKHSDKEYKKQLRDQQDAINKTPVKEWLKNREEFANRDKKVYNKKAKKARDKYRKTIQSDKYNEYRKQGLNKTDASKKADEFIKGKAALHNPDGIAGGKIDSITGLGDSKVNSSIGSQWRHGRAQSIESQVKSNYGIPPKTIDNIPDSAIMNINLF